MVQVSVCAAEDLERTEVLELYGAVGWTAYTEAPEVLIRALGGSHRLVVARREGHLVGLARSISDGATVVHVQDVLVHPDEQRTGLGRRLMDELFAGYEGVRQRLLLTDDEDGQRAFYEALGFVAAHDHRPPLRSFVRFD
ncbi:GNAT family N-acetyltransferase [Nocardiopsis sp. JB363]|uniref:GNAT family N-acetyltransferase n=1 Tax=Nocardiopsis sp. JB363 TaxID=1434837 RepID=UPI000979CBCD|nr:GNAT family N-acetyltransferase [Nocardiopsis sp. JB363]SIO88717.1 acetyltransferase, GNAT family [Nocardiopsis sp. JB363]